MRPQQPNFKLTRQAILLGVISAAYPMAGYCVAAGRADFVVGNVEAVTADGSRRPLAKGSEVNAGDAINTAAGARAQVRFADGGYVSLQPNTVFRVDQFNYQNKTDGEEKGFFSLLKGGLRTITGAIGKVNRDTYKVATPNATIGIRGTGYKAEIRDDGLFVSVGEGAISLTNNVGLLVVTAGNAAFVASPNTPPQPSREQPRMPPAPLQPISTILLPILPTLSSGAGYALGYAGLGTSSALSGITAQFNSTGQLIQFSNTNGASGNLASGSITFSATDGIIGWGRWTGSFATTASLTGGSLVPSPGIFDYIVGIPTPVLPSGQATYNLMGYTTPTALDGSTGYTISSGSLVASFTPVAAAPNVTVNLTVQNSTNSYVITNGLTTITGSTFTGSTSCGSGCSASINGFFAGANAERAGLTYTLSTNTTISGVAAFAKQ